MTKQTYEVLVYFGEERYRVEVEYDPQNPPSDPVVLDQARDKAIRKHSPAASFRKGRIIE